MNKIEDGDILIPIKQPSDLRIKVLKYGETLFRGEVISDGYYGIHSYRVGQSDLWNVQNFKLENDIESCRFKKGDIVRATTLKNGECLLIISLWNNRTSFMGTVVYSDLNGLESGDIISNCDQAKYELANIDLVFKLKGNGNS